MAMMPITRTPSSTSRAASLVTIGLPPLVPIRITDRSHVTAGKASHSAWQAITTWLHLTTNYIAHQRTNICRLQYPLGVGFIDGVRLMIRLPILGRIYGHGLTARLNQKRTQSHCLGNPRKQGGHTATLIVRCATSVSLDHACPLPPIETTNTSSLAALPGQDLQA